MGILAERFDEIRNDAGWLTRDDGEELGEPSTSGVRVNMRSALGLTTVWRCVDLLSSAISQAPKDVIVKVGGQSFPEFNPPAWLSAPNPSDPTYTIDDYFSQVALSLLFSGEYFTYAYPYVWDPQVLTVLMPSRVRVKPGPIYEILDDRGKVIATLGPMEMLHGTWIRPPGELRGIAPLEALRRGIGSAIAAEDFGARFFGQGASLAFGVEVPGTLDETQRTQLSSSLRKRHAGLQNSHAIGVLTGGAKFVSGLAPTPEQAQMLATRKFSVEDLCRPFGVPPGMAGSQEPGASSYASAYVFDHQFKERAVLPLATRIERQHNRLLSVPANLAGTGASVQFKFNLDAIARVDLLSRYQANSEGIRGGFLTPREARQKEDLAPRSDNSDDNLFMQVQMAPLSAIVKAQNTADIQVNPRPIPGARSAEEQMKVENHFHVNADAIRMDPPPAPVVNVAAPVVNVESPTVNVDNGEMADAVRSLGEAIAAKDADELRALQAIADRAAPVVNMTMPEVQRMEIVKTPGRVTKRVVERDLKNQITNIYEQSTDG